MTLHAFPQPGALAIIYRDHAHIIRTELCNDREIGWICTPPKAWWPACHDTDGSWNHMDANKRSRVYFCEEDFFCASERSIGRPRASIRTDLSCDTYLGVRHKLHTSMRFALPRRPFRLGLEIWRLSPRHVRGPHAAPKKIVKSLPPSPTCTHLSRVRVRCHTTCSKSPSIRRFMIRPGEEAGEIGDQSARYPSKVVISIASRHCCHVLDDCLAPWILLWGASQFELSRPRPVASFLGDQRNFPQHPCTISMFY